MSVSTSQRRRSEPDTYKSVEAAGAHVELPAAPAELRDLALEAITADGMLANWLTPYGRLHSIAIFASGRTEDAFYNDGRVLLKAYVARKEHK